MTLLTIIQDAADLVGVARPGAVMASTDTQVRQLLACANIEGKTLAKRTEWQELILEASFATIAQEDQGELESKAPGYNWTINQTTWNRDTQRYVDGSLSSAQWQAEKALVTSGPYHEFMIRAQHLNLIPAPPAGQTIAFDYISRYWCQSAGGSGQERWGADSDTGILSEDLMTKGVIWRFKHSKGLEYGEDMADYEIDVNNAIARSGARRVLCFDNYRDDDYRFSIRAPEGSWTP